MTASAQSNNLLKNANGDDALKFWTVMGNATVAECVGAEKCFSLTQDAFLYQDVEISDGTPGTFAVLISLSSIEEPNASQQQMGRPYLFGYFMNSRELRTAKILANLSGQEMSQRPSSSGEWVRQSGVFKIAEGTRAIRMFLRSGCAKSEASATCSSHFRKPGVFLFNSEEEAKAFIATYQ